MTPVEGDGPPRAGQPPRTAWGRSWQYTRLEGDPEEGVQGGLGAVGVGSGRGEEGLRGPPPGSSRQQQRANTAASGASELQEDDTIEKQTRSHVVTRWAVPALGFLGGLFVQNAGLYHGTRSYIQWMDELNQARLRPQSASSTDGAQRESMQPLQGGALDDLFFGIFGQHEVETFALDTVTTLLPFIWMAWMIRTKDLRLWTHTLLTGTLLATLKGFLAWTTIVPDAEGWESCQDRLGPDGLIYFREKADRFFVALLDILMLQVRGIWSAGRAQRSRFCADTVFSSPTYFYVLFSASFFDAMRCVSERLEGRQRALLRGALGGVLLLVLIVDTALSIANRYHYTVDIFIAIILTLLVYGNPAVALATSSWLESAQGSAAELFVAESATDTMSSAFPASGSRPGSADDAALEAQQDFSGGASSVGPDVDRRPRDAGQLYMIPCCAPPWEGEGLCYLRTQPDRLARHSQVESIEAHRRRQAEHFAQMKEQQSRRQRRKEAMLGEERAGARLRLAEASAAAERRLKQVLAEEARNFDAEERRLLAEAERRLEVERNQTSKWDDKVANETKRFSLQEADVSMECRKIAAEVELVRKEAEETAAARLSHEDSSKVTEGEAQGLRLRLSQMVAQIAVKDVVSSALTKAADLSEVSSNVS
eukprot:gnl/TRDRNA2_/TRDRNA2_81125_c0_seq1.p1 gnl/TRDRNA2_/TRDRNA2_81125_c0~~gnl/TRDRNA2_/TRDRNA2_81125_c0_seq1.p1  ORF type:complete len:653 (-),score=112.49 gnl/TRDRNA2_/TRDRNA2_81125_c0_seq1:111-2069(-)